MRSCDAEEKGCFSSGNTTDSMVKPHGQEPEPLGPFLGHPSQLVLGHLSMDFIIDCRDWLTIFQRTHVAKEISNRARIGHLELRIESERAFDQGDLANVICHGLNLLV